MRQGRSWAAVLGLAAALLFSQAAHAAPSYPESPWSSAVLAQVNRYRALAGVPQVRLETALNEAANYHAHFVVQHWESYWSAGLGAHDEPPGIPGSIGSAPQDRAAAFGEENAGGEVMEMGFGLDETPLDAVDGWMATVGHRDVLLSPAARAIGVGYATGTSGSGPTFASVVDVGQDDWSLQRVATYPADGQMGVPLQWDGNEIPSPLPAGARCPCGYPVTVFGVYPLAGPVTAELTSGGQPVPFWLYHDDHDIALIPTSPLRPGATYRVHVAGAAGWSAEPFDLTWEFSTMQAPADFKPGPAVFLDAKRLGVPSVLVGGRTLVPLRALGEALGAEVDWSPDLPLDAVLTKGGVTVHIRFGNFVATVNGARRVLDVPPLVSGGTGWMPVRFLSEALGLKVEWKDGQVDLSTQ